MGNISYLQGMSVSIHNLQLLMNKSTRIDQTTRIHAALPTNKDDDEPVLTWHEVGRPQVHGYDLLGVVSLDPLRFVSVADEKVARVFGAPRNFVKTIQGLGIVDLEVDEVKSYLASAND